MKTKVISLLLLQFAIIGAANAENKIYVGSSKHITNAGNNYDQITLNIKNTDEIQTLNFDLVLPEGYSIVGNATCTKNGRFQEEDFLGEVSDAWMLNTTSFTGFVSVAGANSNGNLMPAGDGVTISMNFKVEGEYSTDFTFNNVAMAAADGVVVDAKFYVGKLGKNGYSSYCSSEDVLIEGATAYFATIADDGETVLLKQATDNTVAFGNGVILKGVEDAEIWATSLATAPAAPGEEENILSFTLIGTEAKTPVHVLSTNGGVTGFYTYTGWIPAGKAYLEGYTSGNLANIRFADETGIEEISAEDLDGVIFNLNGQKVNEVKKGIHVVNGKKVMF